MTIIYKDLMVAKRELLDLRESINKTMRSIRESDQRLDGLEERRKKMNGRC